MDEQQRSLKCIGPSEIILSNGKSHKFCNKLLEVEAVHCPRKLTYHWIDLELIYQIILIGPLLQKILNKKSTSLAFLIKYLSMIKLSLSLTLLIDYKLKYPFDTCIIKIGRSGRLAPEPAPGWQTGTNTDTSVPRFTLKDMQKGPLLIHPWVLRKEVGRYPGGF